MTLLALGANHLLKPQIPSERHCLVTSLIRLGQGRVYTHIEDLWETMVYTCFVLSSVG